MDWLWYILFTFLGITLAFIVDTWTGISTITSSVSAGN